MPLFGQLDQLRFEVQYYSASDDFSTLENQERERPATTQLPTATAEQLGVLRAAELDMLVFASDLSAPFDGVARLALERIAPLQVALPLAVHTTGLSTIDLFLAGVQVANLVPAQHFSERLGLWSGPSLVVNRELGRRAAGQSWTKVSLGIAADSVVFVSEASYEAVTPAVIEAWAQLLAKVPESQLVLHPFGAGEVDGLVAARFGSAVESASQRHGVDAGRLLLSTMDLPNPGDVQALLSVGDIYLEAFNSSSAEGLLRALEAGLPIIACEGKSLRAGVGAAWLKSLGLDTLVANNAGKISETKSTPAVQPTLDRIAEKLRAMRSARQSNG